MARRVEAYQIAARIEVDGKRAQAVLRDVEKQAKSTTAALGGTKGTIGVKVPSGAALGSGDGSMLGNLTGLLQLAPGLGQVASLALKGAGALQSGVEMGIDFNDAVKKAQITFETFSRSPEKAVKHIGELKELATSSSLDFKQLLSASSLAQGFKTNIKDATEELRVFLDVSAGKQAGLEGVEQQIRAFGKMRAQTKVMGEGVESLRDLGVDVFSILADYSGQSYATIKKLSEQGKLSFEKSYPIILDALRKDFGGLDARVARETVEGGTSALRDAMDQTMGRATEQTTERYKQVLRLASDAINSDLGQSMAGGVDKAAGFVFDTIERGIYAASSGTIADLAGEVVGSFSSTLRSLGGDVFAAGQEAGGQLEKGIRDILDMHSPSRVMQDLGAQAADSFTDTLIDRTSEGFRKWREQIEKNGGDDFVAAVEALAKRIGANPAALMNVMAFESSLNPHIRNKKSSATGLIQKMSDNKWRDSRARYYGMTRDQFAAMTALEQLAPSGPVERYFQQFGYGRIRTDSQAYAAVAAGQVLRSDSGVLYRAGSKEYNANKVWDANRDGLIQQGELGRLASMRGGFTLGGSEVSASNPLPVSIVRDVLAATDAANRAAGRAALQRPYRERGGDLTGGVGVFIDENNPAPVEIVEGGEVLGGEISDALQPIKQEFGRIAQRLLVVPTVPLPGDGGGNKPNSPVAAAARRGTLNDITASGGGRYTVAGRTLQYTGADGREIENPTRAQAAAAGLKAAYAEVKSMGQEAFGEFAQGIGNMVEDFVLLGETGPDAMRKLVASTLAGVASQSAVLAVFELAKGFASLFFNPAEASAHFTAAALFGSIAGVTAVAGRAVAGDTFKDKNDSSQTSEQQNQAYADPGNPANNFTRRATGGRAYRGRAYIVGDGGREEVFEPNEDGYVHPSVAAYERAQELRRKQRSLERGGLHGWERMIHKALGSLAAQQERLADELGRLKSLDAGTFLEMGARRNPAAIGRANIAAMDADAGLIRKSQQRLQVGGR